MNPTREEALFALALGTSPEKRAALLDVMCEGDPSVRARIEALLAAHDGTGGILAADSMPEELTPTLELPEPVADEAVGQTLGRYRLLERVGEGGCGVVYVAEQTEPVRRRVALKVIKLGMDTKQVVARFEAERQALALMDHPNIAKVLDAGTTELGRPYFVMELVRGIKITDYCDQGNLTTKDRLDLFIKACHAIQHAHQKGIIHRDIKPSNILVTLHDGVPVPKVIDFGIAKATEGRLTDVTIYTQLHQFIGTPAYMSPEQAEMSGLDIDTRSDIYSLGVLLYQLLTGKTPFDGKELQSMGLDAMRRAIREMEPPRPSTRVATLRGEELTTTAKRRSADAPRLIHLLQGDLDWIVMKCLEKDRQRRYETANGLAADITRHLTNEPVTARPPSTAYRLQKAFRRNRLAFIAGAAVVCALVIGLGLAALGWRQTDLARQNALQSGTQALAAKSEAEQERQRARAGEAQAKLLLYAADMNLAQQSLDQNNLGRARELLDRHRPAPGEDDLRGWEWRYLWQQCRGDALAVLTQRPTMPGFSVSFSPDGAHLAVGFRGGPIQLWDVTHRVLLKEVPSTAPFGVVAFSPKSNLLASVTERGTLKMHDFANGRENVLWDGADAIRDLSFTPDGSRLVAFTAGPGEPCAVTFDVALGKALHTNTTTLFNLHMGSARLSPDKRRLYLSHQELRDGLSSVLRVKCLDSNSGREIWSGDPEPRDGITAMALSPDGKFLVTGTGFEAAPIRVLDTETGKLVATLDGHNGWVGELVFSPDGRCLASAAADQTIRLWETTNWTQTRVLRGHVNEVWTVGFSPDGRMLASGSKDGAILLWDIAGQTPSYGYRPLPPDASFAGEFAPGMVHVQVSDVRGLGFVALKLQDLSRSQAPILFGTNLTSVFRPPNIFAEYNRTNELRIWEAREVASEVFLASVGSNVVLWNRGGTRRLALAYARGDRQVAWGEVPETVHIASIEDPVRRWKWKSELHSPAPRLFTPDGRRVYLEALPPERGFEVREVVTGKLILRADLPVSRPKPYFADSGRKLVMAMPTGSDTEVVFWDLLRPEQPPVRFEEHDTFNTLSVSPEGRWVAGGGDSGVAVLYDATTMKRVRTLHGMMLAVSNLAFSPDSRCLAASSNGREAVRLWQVETGQDLLTLAGKGSQLSSLVFAENGNTILVGGPDKPGSWQMWRAPSWEVIHATEEKEKAGGKKP